MSRIEELRKNLFEVNQLIEKACADSNRNPSEITLIAVTKTWPASDIRLLHEIGLRNFGESKDQEAALKVQELADLEIVWHFIGQIQTNKLNHIASYADVIHGIDRPKVVMGLESAAAKHNRHITALIQVSLDADPLRGGVVADKVEELADQIESCKHLDFGGLMAVAPLEMDRNKAFGTLLELSKQIQMKYPRAKIISAGMSEDAEIAIKNGATHLRIGSALLGNRA